MSLAATQHASATYATRRRCPYHGEWIRLADCPIVATNERPLQSRTAGADPLPPVDLSAALGGTGAASPAPETSPAHTQQPIVIDLALHGDASEHGQRFVPGTHLASLVDGRQRLIVSPPQRPRAEGTSRRFARSVSEPLASPATLAREFGGQRVRPVRACPDPRCHHPLPASIDLRDPISIALVGNARATKSTSVAALMCDLQRHGPGALGVRSFSPAEATSAVLRPMVQALQDGGQVVGTDGGVFRPPLEFTMEAEDGSQLAVLVHDVAGETLMDADERMQWAPHVLWSDVVLFLYNPEESPVVNTLRSTTDQSAVLAGIFDDLEKAPPVDADGAERWPHLVIAVSKADLLPHPPTLRGAPPPAEEVVRALHNLHEGGLVHAAERWDDVHWHFVAPNPPSGEPQGISQLFRRVLQLAAS